MISSPLGRPLQPSTGRGGLAALVRKELADQFGALRLALLTSLIFMAALIAAFLAGEGVRGLLAGGLGQALEGRAFLMLFSATAAGLPIFSLLAVLGPVWAMALGFDAISRERAQGTLSKLLAQPLSRLELILGKFLAGLLTIALMSGALFLLISGLGLAVAGLIPSGEEVLRLLVFWLATVVYLGFWLAAALLMSVIFKSAAVSALASGTLWLLLAFLITLLAGGAAGFLAPVNDPFRPAQNEVLANEETFRRLSLASPVNVYDEAAAFLLDPGRRSLSLSRQQLDRAVTHRYTGRFQGPLDFGQSFILLFPHLAGLLAWTALAFALSALAFSRQEIRSGG